MESQKVILIRLTLQMEVRVVVVKVNGISPQVEHQHRVVNLETLGHMDMEITVVRAEGMILILEQGVVEVVEVVPVL